MGDVVFGIEAPGGSGQASLDVSIVACDLPRLAGGFLERCLEGGRIVAAVGAVFPGDLEGPAPLNSCPRVSCDHTNAAERVELGRGRTPLDLDHADHPWHLESLGRIVVQDLS